MPTIQELEAKVNAAHNHMMYYEAAERGYDASAASQARAEYHAAMTELKEARIAGTPLEKDLATVKAAKEAYREIIESLVATLAKHGLASRLTKLPTHVTDLLANLVGPELQRLWDADIVESVVDDSKQFRDKLRAVARQQQAEITSGEGDKSLDGTGE